MASITFLFCYKAESKATVGVKYFRFMHLYSYSRLEHAKSSESWKSQMGLHYSSFSVNGPKITKNIRDCCVFSFEKFVPENHARQHHSFQAHQSHKYLIIYLHGLHDFVLVREHFL